MRSILYPNGVYGFNLTVEMLSRGYHDLHNNIVKFIECLENGESEFNGSDIDRNAINFHLVNNYDSAFWYFYDEIRSFMKNECDVIIPEIGDCFDPESDNSLLFSIEQIWSGSDFSSMEADFEECPCDEGDIILGISIAEFPNDIKLDRSFTKEAFWYLWTVIS